MIPMKMTATVYEGARPSKAAYGVIHQSEARKKEAETLKDLNEKLREKEIYRKVLLVI